MARISLFSSALAAALAIGPAVSAQNLDERAQDFLDRVEKRVEKARDRTAPRRDASPPATVPPESPAESLDDLPPPAPVDAAPGAAVADDPALPGDTPVSGYLGVVLNDLPSGGVRVDEIVSGSPAEQAGLKVGDTITAVNGAAVKDIEEVGTLMEPVPPGGTLTLTVDRNGAAKTIEATLGEPPAAPLGEEPIELGPALGPGADGLTLPGSARRETRDDAGPGRASLGVSVVTFEGELRQRSDVPARSGALITAIRPESAAAQAGVPRGGVIVALDGQRIDSAEGLVEAIRGLRPGQEVELSYYQGNRLQRKNVTLAAAADPTLLGPGYGGPRDRSLLRGVERAIDRLAPPRAAVTPPADLGPPTASADETALRQEIAALRTKVETLESRLAELEAKLGPGEAAPLEGATPAVDNPANPAEDAPPTLRPRTPRTPAGAKIGDE